MFNDFRLSRVWLFGLCCLGLAACESAPTQVDQYFGWAVQQAQFQQTQNLPMASCARGHSHMQCMVPSQGGHHQHRGSPHHVPKDSDGESAQSAIQRYQESFASPSQAPAGVSAGSGSLIKR